MLYVVHGDVELQCLATWNDSSKMYLYGRLVGFYNYDNDDGFRCFVRDAFGVIVSYRVHAI